MHGDLQLSAHSLGKLGEHGIGIVILSGRNRRPLPIDAQLETRWKTPPTPIHPSPNPDFCLQQSRHICQEKLQAQLEHLHQYRQPPIYRHIKSITQHLSHISHSPSIAQIRGIEGAAAAQYFCRMAAHHSAQSAIYRRNRRPPRDPVNSLLSLGYTLLHFETVKHLHLCGLDPYIGYYHQTEHGRESLACDLIEALRPQYDQWIIQHIKQQRYRAQDFRITANNCSINKTARQHFYQDYEQLAKQLRPQSTTAAANYSKP
nr:CRISPR-associated endonuclease Cas1 [Suttonella indologenes]